MDLPCPEASDGSAEALNQLVLGDGARLATLLRQEDFRELLRLLEPTVARLGGSTRLSDEQQYALSDVARRFAEPSLRATLAATLMQHADAPGLSPQARGWTLTAAVRLLDPDVLKPPVELYQRIMVCSRDIDGEHRLNEAEEWLQSTGHLSLGALAPGWWREYAGRGQTDEYVEYPFRIEAFSPHHPPGWYEAAVEFLTGKPLRRR